MANHDASYDLLFSNAQRVADLLLEFVHEEWVKQLDFSSLERVSGSYVIDALRDREIDVIWRVRRGSEWAYIYLLLEIQSTVDRYIAVRMATYVGLLYQDLINAKPWPEDGKLPPVFSIMLCNGVKLWDTAEERDELIAALPPALESYRPSLRDLMLDEGLLSEAELRPLRNGVAAIFRFENAETVRDIRGVLEVLTNWFSHENHASIEQSVITWLTRDLLPAKFPGIEIPQVSTLQQMSAMLEEQVNEWMKAQKR